jgi:hypothetical protein
MKLVTVPDWFTRIPGLRSLVKPLGSTSGGSTLTDKDKQVVVQIIQEFKDLSRRELDTWRQALQAIEAPKPNWQPLQDFYDYLDADGILGVSIELRLAATLGKKYMVYSKSSGKETIDKTNIFLHKEWFFNFMYEFLYTNFKKYTLAQLVDPVTMKWYYIPRRNYVPERNFIKTEAAGEKGIYADDPAFDRNPIIAVQSRNKYGILNDIIPNLIWLKNARQCWDEFAQKFGIHLVTATSNSRDKKELDRMEAMLKSLGEAATGVFPQGTEIKIHDSATKGDPYNVFLKSIELDLKVVTTRVLGGSMITMDGSSRSQAEVHERNLHHGLALFDKMLIQFVVNDYLMPVMAKFGYPFTDDDAFKFDESESLTFKEQWDILSGILDHYEVEDGYVAEKFNIPIIGKKQASSTTASANFNTANSAMAEALLAAGITLPNYTKPVCGHNHAPLVVADSLGFTGNILAELSDAMINAVWGGKPTFTLEVLKSIASHKAMLDALLEGWGERRMELTYSATDNRCLAAMEYNLFEFSRLKEKANVFALNQLLIDKEANNIRSFTDFRNKALTFLKNADENHLKTEYYHSVAVGQGASRYHQFMSEADLVTPYGQIQTAGDARVRLSHHVLDGKIISFKNGAPTIWVPFDIGCRCEILQYLDEVDKEKLYTSDKIYEAIGKKKGDKWTGNRAAEEAVFRANEMYVKELGLGDEINKLPYSIYGLKPYDEIKAEYDDLKLDKTITPDNIDELYTPEPGQSYMGFTDYLGRKLTLKQPVFDKHVTTPKHIAQGRHQLFAHLQDVLTNPDEVYYFQFNKGNYQHRYVKFYGNGALVVSTKLGSANVEVQTWFNMDNEAGVRRGYLLHKKSRI